MRAGANVLSTMPMFLDGTTLGRVLANRFRQADQPATVLGRKPGEERAWPGTTSL